MSDLVLPDKPVIMGILNNSPDSFYEESIHQSTDGMVREAKEMIEAGAGIIDIGAESSKPDAKLISSEEEKERLEPCISELAHLDALVSVDTWKADVAQAAIEAGADIINDISGLNDPEMSRVAAEYDVPIVLGHSTDVRATLNENARYDDVVKIVFTELKKTVEHAKDSGVSEGNIIIDPGIYFGESISESLELIARLEEFQKMGYPLLVAHSRKIMLIDNDEEDNVPDDSDISIAPTVALTTAAVERGANIIRVHDILENKQAARAGLYIRRSDPRY
jgi:dihydropteroate synthase